MDSIRYRNTSQAPTGSPARIVEIIVNDGTDSSIAAISTVTVVPVNDPPVNTVPANQTINEDSSLTFAGAISISTTDVDAGTASLTVIMTATNGTLTLSGTGGLTGVIGNGSGNVGFSGSQTNINSALNGMVFSPTLNFNGTAAVTISTNDQGNTGTGGARVDTDTFNITVSAVADPPAISGVGGTVISIGGTRVLLAPSAVITDVDLPTNWNGYVLSVTIPLTAGLQISDTLVVSATTANSNPPTATGLSVRTRTPAGAVSDQIFYNGVHVGTIDSTLGGEGGEDLVVRFDQNAAQVESVMALIRAIAFSTTNSGISRTVTFTLIDPNSLSSNQPTVTVNIP